MCPATISSPHPDLLAASPPPDENDCSSNSGRAPTSRSFGRRRPRWRESSSIQTIPKNLFTPIALAHQMIDSFLVLDSQLARHRQLFDPIINLPRSCTATRTL